MIKLKNLIYEIEDESIDTQRLFWNESYLDDVTESLGYNVDFNKLFWSHPKTLFHCTIPEKYKLITSTGKLLPMNLTRGINNRGIGHAIFTTMEELEVETLKKSYGNIVIKINTDQMKQDRFMPYLSKEPEVEQAEKISFVLNKLGKNKETSELIDNGGGISEYTVIIYEPVPIKYLSLYD